MQEYRVNAIVPQGSIVGLTHFLLYINDMMLPVTSLPLPMIPVYSKCDQASDLWQQLEFASELESDLRHTVD